MDVLAYYHLDTAALRQRIERARSTAYVGTDPSTATLLGQAPEFGGLVRFVGYISWLILERRK